MKPSGDGRLSADAADADFIFSKWQPRSRIACLVSVTWLTIWKSTWINRFVTKG